MKVPRYILILSAVFVFTLMLTCLAYVWFPEIVSKDIFVRIAVSFFVVLTGSVALAVLGRILSAGHDSEHKK